MRAPHILKRNHALEMPWEAIWYDTETHQHLDGFNAVRHSLWFGWAAYRRRLARGGWSAPDWIRFQSISEYWEWVESKLHGRSLLYTFAHNAGFDLPILDAFGELPRRGFKLTKAVIDCPPVILKWRREHQSLAALDTLNIWRMPLEGLGKQIGLPKLTMPAKDASQAEWDTYGRRDTEIIMQACLNWWEFLTHHRLGGFAPTLASQAMRAYRHRFMTHPLLVDDHQAALELARGAYVGGRVECYRIGRVEGPIYRPDVNSMYPAVMRGNPYPTRLVGHSRRCTIADLEEWTRERCVIAQVDIFTPEPAYPVLHNDKLLFPINRFTTCLPTPELKRALEHGHIVKVHQAAVYERGEIFSAFVGDLWQLRMEARARGDAVSDWQLKILANSLYGKFGQRGRVYMEAGAAPTQEAKAWLELDMDTGHVYKHRALGGLHQVWRDDSESRDSLPAIAAHVTSYARLALWEWLSLAGWNDVYYCDTDGFACSEAAYDRLRPYINPDALGMLKLEGVEQWGIYRGPKDYEYPSHAKIKGVRKRAHWVGPSDIVQEQWSTLLGLIRAGDVTAPVTRLVTKHLERRYAKGLVTPSGRVLPYSLG